MASKFSEFIEQNKIDPRRLLAASKRIEQLQLEDRLIKIAKKKAKGADNKKDESAEAPSKPRSGRPVTPRLFAAASEGKTISGPAKTRLLRAVNRILEQKKQDPVDLRALF